MIACETYSQLSSARTLQKSNTHVDVIELELLGETLGQSADGEFPGGGNGAIRRTTPCASRAGEREETALSVLVRSDQPLQRCALNSSSMKLTRES